MRIKNLIRSLFVFTFFVPVFTNYTTASDYKYTNLDCDKKFTDVKLKDNNSGINFNQIGNKTVSFPVSSPKNKSGVKLNMQYSSSYEDDLGPRNK